MNVHPYVFMDFRESSSSPSMASFKPHVIAIRIYVNDVGFPMADLRMSDGVVETIRWATKERKKFEEYINGYTLYYDEREKRDWEGWLS